MSAETCRATALSNEVTHTGCLPRLVDLQRYPTRSLTQAVCRDLSTYSAIKRGHSHRMSTETCRPTALRGHSLTGCLPRLADLQRYPTRSLTQDVYRDLSTYSATRSLTQDVYRDLSTYSAIQRRYSHRMSAETCRPTALSNEVTHTGCLPTLADLQRYPTRSLTQDVCRDLSTYSAIPRGHSHRMSTETCRPTALSNDVTHTGCLPRLVDLQRYPTTLLTQDVYRDLSTYSAIQRGHSHRMSTETCRPTALSNEVTLRGCLPRLVDLQRYPTMSLTQDVYRDLSTYSAIQRRHSHGMSTETCRPTALRGHSLTGCLPRLVNLQRYPTRSLTQDVYRDLPTYSAIQRGH